VRKAEDAGASNNNSDDEDLHEGNNEAGWKINDETERAARFEELENILGNKRR
jgi:hypothetical protein